MLRLKWNDYEHREPLAFPFHPFKKSVSLCLSYVFSMHDPSISILKIYQFPSHVVSIEGPGAGPKLYYFWWVLAIPFPTNIAVDTCTHCAPIFFVFSQSCQVERGTIFIAPRFLTYDASSRYQNARGCKGDTSYKNVFMADTNDMFV